MIELLKLLVTEVVAPIVRAVTRPTPRREIDLTAAYQGQAAGRAAARAAASAGHERK